jgi:riboflavin synthase
MMFTGIVTAIGRIDAISGEGPVRRIRIAADYDASTIDLGASIACGGPCLTVVARGPEENGCWFEVDAAAETLARTTVGTWRVDTRVNLERSLRIGDELGGHLVTGHVDGTAPILAREAITGSDDPWGATARFVIEAPAKLARFIAEKGSVCLDGTSLTVNSVEGRTFSVLLIPHTLNVTTWGERRPRDLLNLEVDLMARYAARLAEAGGGE